MRLFIAIFLLFVSHSVFSEEEQKKELPPLNPAYEAEHGMALINQGSRIYAANFAGYKAPSNFQVVYEIENPDVAFLSLVRDEELITLKPKPFNLERLLRGEEFEINADIYSGHYQRGGTLVYKDRTITMSGLLYSREMKDLKESSKWHEYDMINLKGTKRIYIHKIQKAPSFSHMIFVDLTSACMPRIRTSKVVPSKGELTYKFVNCGTLKPLFYDTESYQ
jgi:hypothetical protein